MQEKITAATHKISEILLPLCILRLLRLNHIKALDHFLRYIKIQQILSW